MRRHQTFLYEEVRRMLLAICLREGSVSNLGLLG
jgi:hypothetical protein